MWTIVSKYFLNKNVVAMAIFPFIIVREAKTKNNLRTMNHETIHLVQQVELLWFIFFVWYLAEFTIRLCITRNASEAYRTISFEREAYENDDNLDYLKTRKFFSFIKYL
ncbi:hypothetical protein [Weeksella virosa]|uniref:DUF4157 domain-containing protein n=1 Tax=Weeksella virosa (strain ATCC 43766 / DSM 16922 / JCM 21250 / CCUG 30538 / CDC 9751 / IAM 14551 / NBRC 16016 / NCTC 11634 / CL345/78) TaxID=865938 RepID=F0P110_WEEVC|nr:hypothetical protein [Weeksella virosa]ADX68594.1 hypothetical protein Weevi_1909 [Weeksella virosa DSM 16922]MDK7375189.1 hypothetical protein [Weeksella virosa]MDK7675231.1 hypothetical protein [Weeksella virosa]VEH63743.1 Uncharacterised protein [Weeksella virosa]